MHGVARDVPAEVVGRAVHMPAAHAAACHPHRVRAAEVIAAGRRLARTLAERRAAEFAAPDHKRLVEKPALLEVAHERRARLIGVAALDGEMRMQVSVLVPARVHQLHEADAALGEPPRDQAVVREGSRHERVGAVHLDDRLRLVREIKEIRHARLHAERHLVLRDARLDRGILGDALVVARAVERGKVVEQIAARCTRGSRRIRKIRHGIGARPEAHALQSARQEAVRPVVLVEELPAGLLAVGRGHRHEARQVVGFATEPVRKPRAHRWAARLLRTRHEEGHARRVVDGLGVHRAHEADVVSDASDMRQKLADLHARLAPRAERLDRGKRGPSRVVRRHRREAGAAADRRGDVGACVARQLGLRVEEVDMRRATALPEADHPLRAPRKVREARQPAHLRRRTCAERIARKERCKRDAADPVQRRAQEMAARQESEDVVGRFVHRVIRA